MYFQCIYLSTVYILCSMGNAHTPAIKRFDLIWNPTSTTSVYHLPRPTVSCIVVVVNLRTRLAPRRIMLILYSKLSHSTRFICRGLCFVHQNDIETARFLHSGRRIFSHICSVMGTRYSHHTKRHWKPDGLCSIFVFCFVVLVLFSIVVLLIFCYKWYLCRCMRLDHVFFCSHLPSCLSLLGVVVFVTLTFSSYLLVALILVFLLQLYLTALLSLFRFYHQHV